MATLTTTSVTQTYLRGADVGTSFTTTSASYVDVTNLSIASVPNGSKIYFSLSCTKSTAGTMDVRITDGTNVFFEQTGIATGGVLVLELTGTNTQNSGGAATVKVQILSSDGNNATVNAVTTGTSWITATDCSAPLIITAGGDSLIVPGKRSLGTLKVYYGAPDTTNSNTVTVNGISHESGQTGESGATIDVDVMTNEIRLDFLATPVWTDTLGQAAVIVGFDSTNIEVTP